MSIVSHVRLAHAGAYWNSRSHRSASSATRYSAVAPSSARPAVRMPLTGGGWPVISSTWRAAWWTSSLIPGDDDRFRPLRPPWRAGSARGHSRRQRPRRRRIRRAQSLGRGRSADCRDRGDQQPPAAAQASSSAAVPRARLPRRSARRAARPRPAARRPRAAALPRPRPDAATATSVAPSLADSAPSAEQAVAPLPRTSASRPG